MDKPARPSIEDDLDATIRNGAGRRCLAALVKEGMVDSPLGRNPEETAFNLGALQTARNLDRRLRAINFQAWALMHKEMDEVYDERPYED